jgi:hypothetical protein
MKHGKNIDKTEQLYFEIGVGQTQGHDPIFPPSGPKWENKRRVKPGKELTPPVDRPIFQQAGQFTTPPDGCELGTGEDDEILGWKNGIDSWKMKSLRSLIASPRASPAVWLERPTTP